MTGTESANLVSAGFTLLEDYFRFLWHTFANCAYTDDHNRALRVSDFLATRSAPLDRQTRIRIQVEKRIKIERKYIMVEIL